MIGSFAISNDIVIIVLGLSAGAMFVRSLTVHLVRQGTLKQYVFLEHGAHYAIGALAIIMLASLMLAGAGIHHRHGGNRVYPAVAVVLGVL